MPSAEIITIGTEILLGEIVDTNAQFLALTLREAGIDLYRKTTVGDNVSRIAQAIQESLKRSDIVITTGGLGPTVDDPTREAVALAAGVESQFQPELWEQIKRRFDRLGRIPTENNRRQAYIPLGAVAFENPVGTAPIFILKRSSQMIIALPGVPSEMKYLMQHVVVPYLHEHYELFTLIKTRVLHSIGVGESQIDDLIGDLEQLTNPTVGLAAHSGQVDVRITVKAESEQESLMMIQPVENTLRERLGEWIYGVDQEILEEIALQPIAVKQWSLTVVEAGLGGNLIRQLAAAKGPFQSGQVLTARTSIEELHELTNSYRNAQHADIGLGVALHQDSDTHEILVVLVTPIETTQFSRRYAGPPESAPIWAFNQSLDLLRRISHDN